MKCQHVKDYAKLSESRHYCCIPGAQMTSNGSSFYHHKPTWSLVSMGHSATSTMLKSFGFPTTAYSANPWFWKVQKSKSFLWGTRETSFQLWCPAVAKFILEVNVAPSLTGIQEGLPFKIELQFNYKFRNWSHSKNLTSNTLYKLENCFVLVFLNEEYHICCLHMSDLSKNSFSLKGKGSLCHRLITDAFLKNKGMPVCWHKVHTHFVICPN